MIIFGRSLFSNSTRIGGFWDQDEITQPHWNDSNSTRIRVSGCQSMEHRTALPEQGFQEPTSGAPKDPPPGSGGKVDLVVKSLIIEPRRRNRVSRNPTSGAPKAPLQDVEEKLTL